MNSSIKVKHLVILILIIGLCYTGYSYRSEILKYISSLTKTGAEKTVDNALIYLNEQKGEHIGLFSIDYSLNLLSKYSFYRIEEWELELRDGSGNRFHVAVKGKTKNAFGMELRREPVFVVEKTEDNWEIIDSYDLFIMDGAENITDFKSDMEKSKLLGEVREKCKIEKWSFESSYGNSVKGQGTVYNGSEIPVEFIKFQITYSNKAGQVTNTDESYAVSGKLYPGQRRNFEWYTANCRNCDRASIKLIFDKN